jgi:hypothetical protein
MKEEERRRRLLLLLLNLLALVDICHGFAESVHVWEKFWVTPFPP